MIEDLKARIQALMHEIEFTHLKQNWVTHLIEMGVEKEDAYKWVAEIGHVVDEYERSLRNLVDVFEETDVENLAVELRTWIKITGDMTVWTIAKSMKRLEGRYEKYLPPEENEEDRD